MSYIYHFCAEVSSAATNRPSKLDGIIDLPKKIISAEMLAALRDQLLELAIEDGKAQDGDEVVITSLSLLHDTELRDALKDGL